jgi:hypothetical protein
MTDTPKKKTAAQPKKSAGSARRKTKAAGARKFADGFERLPNNWKLRRWKDELTGQHFLEIKFPDELRRSNTMEVDYACVDRIPEIVRLLRGRGALMPLGAKAGAAFVSELTEHLPKVVRRKVALPGWHGAHFVLPKRTFGSRSKKLKLSEVTASKCTIRGVAGDIETWKSHVAIHGHSSSYIAFCIMVALAAPLRKYANLPEGAVFNLSGGSGVGKTTAMKCGVSVNGDPDNLADYNATGLSLEELAAAHNDVLLPLDDTEKARLKDVTDLLDKVAHVLPSGRPRQHSRFFAGSQVAPNLRWRSIGLSSSAKTIDRIYEEVARERSDGQKVRLIDIPVLTSGSLGIFDRVTGDEMETERATDGILHDLEASLIVNHGTMISVWIKHLAASKLKMRTQLLIKTFVRNVVPTGTGVEKRLARKFGLVWAAGVIAVNAGLLPWSKTLVRDVVVKMFTAARGSAFATKINLAAMRKRLHKGLSDGSIVPEVTAGQVFSTEPTDLEIFTTTRCGVRVLALVEKGLTKFSGSDSGAQRLLADLLDSGALIGGHGGKRTTQFVFKISAPDKEKRTYKPRFYVFGLSAVAAHLQSKSPQM